MKPSLFVFLFSTAFATGFAADDHSHSDHSRDSYDSIPVALDGGFFAPYEHLHFSALGTPIVHSFGVEPAFTGRDLFLDYRYRSGDGFYENEIETELEWAFTRRLGVILELPAIFANEDGCENANGLGDFVIVPRVLLIEDDRFMLTAQMEVVTPTGTNGFGGETALAPGIASWLDLGHWFTLNSQLAVEHNFDESTNELVFGFGLVKTFETKQASSTHSGNGHPAHATAAAGLLNLHAEITGTTGLDGEESGDVAAEGLIGISYGVNEHIDLRIGYEFPITSPREFDGGITTGLIWHF